MRTKTLLLTAALTAAGIATSMAQGAVYSQNAVGYVNRVAPAGFSILANPLNNGDNKVSTIFPITLPAGFTLYTFHNDGTTAGFGINSFDPDNGWSDADQVFAPGTGGFVFVPGSSPVTITFVGEVPQGARTTALAHGFNLVSSQVPQAGTLQTDLKYTPSNGDTVYQLVSGNYAINSWDPDNGWSSGDPTAGPVIDVAEGFYLLRNAAGAGSWSRTFDVNNPN